MSEHKYVSNLILWGRCRSGRRWFWTAGTPDSFMTGPHGWNDTEADALAAAGAAIGKMAAELRDRLTYDREVILSMRHGYASHRLKTINAERRRARPGNGGADTTKVEFLYGAQLRGYDEPTGSYQEVVAFRVVKKTPKRVYYVRLEARFSARGEEPEIGFVDRQKLEADGEVSNRGRHWSAADSVLYLEPPDTDSALPEPDHKKLVSRLRAEMAASHPDRGGTDAEFIAARARYERAKRTTAETVSA